MKKDYLVDIGKRMAEVRNAQGMTQEVLAEKMNVSTKHISHTERGIAGMSLPNLMLFCKIFNCSMDYIVFGKEMSNPLSKLPEEVVTILNSENDRDVERLNNYLQVYVDLIKEIRR